MKEKYSVNKAKSIDAAPAETNLLFGEIGKRYDLSLTFQKLFVWQGKTKYSTDIVTRNIYTFVDKYENEFVWNTQAVIDLSIPKFPPSPVLTRIFGPIEKISIKKIDGLEKNLRLNVSATVKNHQTYKGRQQTVLKSVFVNSWEILDLGKINSAQGSDDGEQIKLF